MMQMSLEYLLSMEEVGHIVQKFMDVTVKELQSVNCSQFINRIIDDIISQEHLSADKVQDMTYIELICLIDNVRGNSKYERDGQDSVTRQMFYCLNLAFSLIEAGALLDGRGSEDVDRFQDLPIEQFYAYMDSIAVGKDMYAELECIRNGCEYEDYYSILDFFLEKSWKSRRPWSMAESLEEFGEGIKAVPKDIRRLLIDSFYMAFPDRFHVTDICNKYHDSGEDDRKNSSFDDIESVDESARSFHETFSECPNIPGTNIPEACYKSLHLADCIIEGDQLHYDEIIFGRSKWESDAKASDEPEQEKTDNKDVNPAPAQAENVRGHDTLIEKLLTDLSKEQHSPTLYRDSIIGQLMAVLISESIPNALLVGVAGCGKTRIVEELACRIAAKDASVPAQLYGYKVYSLSISEMMAGVSLAGDLEKRVVRLINFLSEEDHKAILFLDEVHMLFNDKIYKQIVQMLKPALGRGQIRMIAAATTQEVKTIDADPAFNRRFTRIPVDELSKEQTKTILMAYKEKISKHYGMELDVDEKLADIMIDIADESCSAGAHRPGNALTLFDRSVALAVVNGQKGVVRLDTDHIEVTARRMTSGNSEVRKFDERIFRSGLARIKGQDDILNNLVKVIKLHDMHIRPRRKPLTFLFAGASGVGKTEVAKIIAGTYICEKPIILNMAEYHSSASINRMIGAPAGYVGFDRNSELPFDALDTNPYQVILLDEFEKCDRAVQRLFMSVFDEGVMMTSFGKAIDFSKAIIIATTNAGCTESKSLGFGIGGENRKFSISGLSCYFDVELLNRFSHIYTFHDISKDIYREIVVSTYEREISSLRTRGTDIIAGDVFDEQLKEDDLSSLVDNSYEPKLGARPALTSVTEFIDNKLLEYMDGSSCFTAAG